MQRRTGGGEIRQDQITKKIYQISKVSWQFCSTSSTATLAGHTSWLSKRTHRSCQETSAVEYSWRGCCHHMPFILPLEQLLVIRCALSQMVARMGGSFLFYFLIFHINIFDKSIDLNIRLQYMFVITWKWKRFFMLFCFFVVFFNMTF